jgi:hypothetical protein
VVADRRDFAGEDFCRVAAGAARALGVGDVEDLVHAGVEGVGLEGLEQLVNQREHACVDLRVEGA